MAPNAATMIESTRSVGYSFESAVSDIIDNSISAFAKHIWIKSLPDSNPYVAILDDGIGMDSEKLREAMRYGADPNSYRNETDLGRFGLGMKTASLSQCKQLTVISLKSGQISATRWDLDRVKQDNTWTLLVLSDNEIDGLPMVDYLKNQISGTLVIWNLLDRVLDKTLSVQDSMRENLGILANHIGLTYHRFMSDEAGMNKISIILNDEIIEPKDPFLTKHPLTRPQPEVKIWLDGGLQAITIRPFILPPPSKISAKDSDLMGGKENLRRLQGFYVYRNKRLIIPGTWFRLTSSVELSNLARVRVDIPSTLDFIWDIDIKKSSATLPHQFRDSFSQYLSKITSKSERVYTYRGRKQNDDGKTYVWDKIKDRDEIHYSINRSHPLVENINNILEPSNNKLFENLLKIIENSLPYNDIKVELGKNNEWSITALSPDDENAMVSQGQLLIDSGFTIDSIEKIEPFSDYPAIINRLRDYCEQRTR